MRFWISCLVIIWFTASVLGEQIWNEDFTRWTLAEAVSVLNKSPWAIRETFTQVIGGIGSGRRGEKEILQTFYVRLLSARPIREAYARIRQIQGGYDKLPAQEKRTFDRLTRDGLQLDVSRWIVVAVGFRSNDPGQELEVKRFFETQTTESLKNTSFLSTSHFSQVPLAAFYPARLEGIGAKFVFPRKVDGIPVVSDEDEQFTFESVIPGADPQLRVVFSVPQMFVEKELVL